MKSNKFFHLKLLITTSLMIIFYNEFLIYWVNYRSWPEHDILDRNENNTRILLIADPQLIGENDEPWYQSWAARWDSDRYLRNTYLLANSYVKPNSTIYLGDLFDEGLKSTDEQFKRYYERFIHIYQCDKMAKIYSIKQIFISGDNDIGGEYPGDRNDMLQKRFENYFGKVVDAFEFNQFINIVKLDLDNTYSFYNNDNRDKVNTLYKNLKIRQKGNSDKAKFSVILNHVSIFMKSHSELQNLATDTNACLIIKGDSHKFYLAKYDFNKDQFTEYDNNRTKKYTLNLKPDEGNKAMSYVYELSIPTCSYRMGVPNMGFGVLTITSSGKSYLSILWLPSRFKAIKHYVVYISLVIAYLVFQAILKKVAFKVFGFVYRKLEGYKLI